MKPTTTAAERRFLLTADLRAKPDAEGNPTSTLAGYALKYNKFSEDLGGFKEVIKPGAFTESLKTADVRALIDHDPSLILGRNTASTLRLIDDEVGLGFEVDVDTRITYASNLLISVGRGDKDQCSFGFFCDECEWDWYPGGQDLVLRSITLGRLFDISVVTYPAYVDTEVALRSLDAIARPDLRSVVRRSARPPVPAQPTPPPVGPSRLDQLYRKFEFDVVRRGR